MTYKLIRSEPSGSLRVGKYSRHSTGVVQNRRYCRTQGNAANNSLTQGTINRAVEFLRRLNVCVVAIGGHFYYSY